VFWRLSTDLICAAIGRDLSPRSGLVFLHIDAPCPRDQFVHSSRLLTPEYFLRFPDAGNRRSRTSSHNSWANPERSNSSRRWGRESSASLPLTASLMTPSSLKIPRQRTLLLLSKAKKLQRWRDGGSISGITLRQMRDVNGAGLKWTARLIRFYI